MISLFETSRPSSNGHYLSEKNIALHILTGLILLKLPLSHPTFLPLPFPLLLSFSLSLAYTSSFFTPFLYFLCHTFILFSQSFCSPYPRQTKLSPLSSARHQSLLHLFFDTQCVSLTNLQGTSSDCAHRGTRVHGLGAV